MSAQIIPLPSPIHLRAGMDAVRQRAERVGANSEALRGAHAILLREMQAGRSTAASVALANATLRAPRHHEELPPCA